MSSPPDIQRIERILRERAERLARPPTQAADEETVEVLEFHLADERYALETAHVHEVHPLRELAPIPCTPAFVRGLVNLRGRLVTVIDLKKFFDLPEQGLTDLHRVIVLRTQQMELGVLADKVENVYPLPVSAIQPPLPTLTGIRAEYLKGVTGARVVILDAARILADPGIIVNEEVPA